MNIINANNIGYQYPDGTVALNNVSLTISDNQKVAIIGHNGSGKSTLLLLLAALLLPTSGSITILDMQLTAKNKSQVRKSIGILFSQVEYQFIMPDLLNDVLLSIHEGSHEEKKLQAIQWLKKVNMDDMLNHSPLALSSGQMKRAALASVLAKNPKILLLDEPLANLDKPSADAVIHILSDLNMPMIFATHSAYAVQHLADRLIVLENGTIAYDGVCNGRIIAKYQKTILL
ncbi:MAG: ABC transporter ATP-binding protein [Spirochaetota bacterium]